jgi:hypothetical protein
MPVFPNDHAPRKQLDFDPIQSDRIRFRRAASAIAGNSVAAAARDAIGEGLVWRSSIVRAAPSNGKPLLAVRPYPASVIQRTGAAYFVPHILTFGTNSLCAGNGGQDKQGRANCRRG